MGIDAGGNRIMAKDKAPKKAKKPSKGKAIKKAQRRREKAGKYLAASGMR